MKDDYIIYEYKSINVKRDLEPIYIDCYEKFGWIHIDNCTKVDYYINSNTNPDVVNIKFKRNRNIKNKEELQILQQKYEKAFLRLDKLEKEPHSLATMYSLIIAIVALAFIMVSILSIVRENILWLIAIICGIFGIIGCVFPYFVYKKVKYKKEMENKVKIDEQQNMIKDICKKTRNILLDDE